MVYAVTALALLTGIAGGTAITWWRLRSLIPAKASKSGDSRQRALASRAHDEEIRRYHMINNALGKLLDAERFEEAYSISRNWCNRAPDFVDSWLKLKGTFELTKLPPVEYTARHLVARRDVGELRRLRDIMMRSEDLKRWQDLLAEEIVAANELERIFDVVEDNPGIAQDTAVRRVDAGMRRALKALHDAEARDFIRRERSGRTYLLYLE
jgi:hypothetical protein